VDVNFSFPRRAPFFNGLECGSNSGIRDIFFLSAALSDVLVLPNPESSLVGLRVFQFTAFIRTHTLIISAGNLYVVRSPAGRFDPSSPHLL